MSNGFLSQEEIDSLLNGGSVPMEPIAPIESMESIESIESIEPSQVVGDEIAITDLDKDLLGEIGNISMGSASTALSQIINQPVHITTPVVTTTTIGEIKKEFHVPNMVLEVEYVSGINGKNILVMKITDAAVIANLMMGGDGHVETQQLSEIEISAVQEAMNQMIGSAATSMATMFAREVNISPPLSKTWENQSEPLSSDIPDSEKVIKVSFKLTIGNLVDSNIMQILPLKTGKTIVAIMMGEEPAASEPVPVAETPKAPVVEAPKASAIPEPKPTESYNYGYEQSYINEKPIEQTRPPVEVHEAAFESLTPSNIGVAHKNIDLILDVPLEISVVLGRTQKSIKDILNLGNGSLIELDKLADEPVEILVNGKRIAYGEVVVVDENFGVRITSIVSNSERLKSLK